MSSNSSHDTTTENEGNAANRGVHIVGINPPAPTPAAPLYAKSRALVIGIDTYQDAANQALTFADGARFKNLHNAVNDSTAIAKLLREEFGFHKDDVVELYNEDATRTAIESYLRDTLPAITGEEDRLVIFFAGHGHTQKGKYTRDVGYLLPYGATEFANAISMGTLTELLPAIGAKHVLLILDCCFSGIVALAEISEAKPIREGGNKLESRTNSPSWEILTAGTVDEPVADNGVNPNHSVFTTALLDGLKGGADYEHDGVITSSALKQYVFNRVVTETTRAGKNQHPVHQQLFKGGPGEVVFLTRRRHLQDQFSRELLELLDGSVDLQLTFATTFQSICQTLGCTPTGYPANPAEILAELWVLGSGVGYTSAILGFVAKLAQQYATLAQECEEWLDRVKAVPLLELHWHGPLPEGKEMGRPILTVCMQAKDVSPDILPENNRYDVNIYCWQRLFYRRSDKIMSFGEIKAAVDGVLQEIDKEYPQNSKDMTVEFCVPTNLLSDPFERWPKSSNSRDPDPIQIGKAHRVVVRSIDDLPKNKPERWENWQRNWKSLMACRGNPPVDPHWRIYRSQEFEKANAVLTSDDESAEQPEIHFLGLSGLPTERKGLPFPLTELLDAGVPSAIWPRPIKNEVADEDGVYKVIEKLLGYPLDELPARVQAVRSQDKVSVARYLTLFWDDYDHIPPHLQRLTPNVHHLQEQMLDDTHFHEVPFDDINL